MKVLIIEDGAANITSAKKVVGDAFGNDAECTVIRTSRELGRLGRTKEFGDFDLVLTDGWIPAGVCDGLSPEPSENLPPDKMVFVGSTVALGALICSVPCLLCTESNHHRDIHGLLLENCMPGRTFELEADEKGQEMVVRKSILKINPDPAKNEDGSKYWIHPLDLKLLFDGKPRLNKHD